MSDNPTWYDLLDVARGASTEEIRAAWKARIADLEPGDRRFDALNRAARVLLDPDARATYDAEHPEVEEPEVEEPEVEEPTSVVEEGALAPVFPPADPHPALVTELRPSSTSAGTPPGWLLAALAIVAAGLVAATVWMWSTGDDGGDDSAARDAQVAAEAAVVPVLSYDYEHLEADQEAAQALMTGKYRTEYDKLFTVLEDNAPQTQTKVTASVVASGIVRASEDRVQVLVFVDRPTTNKLSTEPVVYKDQVTLSMQLVDGEWLVDDLITSPVQG
jgi:Mce-associated membrane protein